MGDIAARSTLAAAPIVLILIGALYLLLGGALVALLALRAGAF